MDDLIQRLRVPVGFSTRDGMGAANDPLRHEAADSIEKLQARVVELEAALEDADEGLRYMHLYEKEDRG